jgi:hypothetical protein
MEQACQLKVDKSEQKLCGLNLWSDLFGDGERNVGARLLRLCLRFNGEDFDLVCQLRWTTGRIGELGNGSSQRGNQNTAVTNIAELRPSHRTPPLTRRRNSNAARAEEPYS